MYACRNVALESNLGRLNQLEFEDVFNRGPIVSGLSPHELYMKQFD